MIKKYFIASICLTSLAGSVVTHAAADLARFDPQTRTISVLGNCSGREVVVLIKFAKTHEIWASSNPPCENGHYKYTQAVPPDQITPDGFDVQTIDGGYSALQQNKTSGATAGSVEKVATPPFLDSGAVVIGDASVTALEAETAGSGFSLDGILQSVFGIVRGVGDAFQQFSTILANTVKATFVAAVDMFTKNLTILPDGAITVPEGANQISGRGMLAAGVAEVFIQNSLVASSSKILLTPTSQTDLPLAVTRKEDGNGFAVGVPRPVSAPVSFDWLLIKTYRAGGDSISVPLANPPVVEPHLQVVLPSSPPPPIHSADIQSSSSSSHVEISIPPPPPPDDKIVSTSTADTIPSAPVATETVSSSVPAVSSTPIVAQTSPESASSTPSISQ